MIKGIPEKYKDLFTPESRSFLFLATTMPDGTPQVTPVWFSTDEEYILINSALGRVKDRNMRRSPHIAAAIMDPNDPYRYIQIRGLVEVITSVKAREHINELSEKYTGQKVYPGAQDEQRVIYKIRPQSYSRG